ncbi:hypothetical protein DL768_002748 [Monosporascus sp. mg162]|nr:hypothetical protein DL768_002748 [Monosporascus sp. mg162]
MEKKSPGQVDCVEPQQEAFKDIIKISKGTDIHAATVAEQKPLKLVDKVDPDAQKRVEKGKTAHDLGQRRPQPWAARPTIHTSPSTPRCPKGGYGIATTRRSPGVKYYNNNNNNNNNKKVDPGQDKVCKSIVDRSKGTCLHAATVVEHLSRTPHVNKIQILKVVEKLPHGMKELLKVAEVNIAHALGLAIDKHPENSVTPEVLRDLLDDNIKIKLDLYCGHIVKLREERLEFIHGSLWSYFLAKLSKSHPELDLDERRSHTLPANICIAYVTLPCFANSGPALEPGRMDLWESKVRKRIRDHAFVRYAALDWYKYLADAR